MAELFLCSGEAVSSSNGAAAALFEGWERLASRRSGMAALAIHLRQCLDGSGVRCMAFGTDRESLPAELAGPAEAAALLTVLERTAADPTVIPDVAWSPELLDWWRGKLARQGGSPEDGAGGDEVEHVPIRAGQPSEAPPTAAGGVGQAAQLRGR